MLLMHNISLILCISKSLSVTTVVPCVTSKCINKSSATKMVDSTLKTESSVPALIEPEVPLPELIRFNNLNSDLTSFSVSKKEFSMCGLPINTSSPEQVSPPSLLHPLLMLPVSPGRFPEIFGLCCSCPNIPAFWSWSGTVRPKLPTPRPESKPCSSLDGHLARLRFTTMVPATMSYTVLLCWKKRRVMKAGKKKAMEKFLLRARTVDADRVTLDAGTTSTRLGRTKTEVSHVTTLRPRRNFPGVAPPAPQIQMIS